MPAGGYRAGTSERFIILETYNRRAAGAIVPESPRKQAAREVCNGTTVFVRFGTLRKHILLLRF